MTPATSSSKPFPYTPFLWYGLALAAAYWSVLNAMAYQWQSDDNMGHGFFVPLIAGFIIWERREEWLNAAERSRWGLLFVAWGMLQLWLGTLGVELFLQRTSFLIVVFGLVLFYGGRKVVRILGLPLFLLLFMVPIPGIAYKQITFPLQLLASGLAESVLDLLGYMVIRDGNVLELAGQTLSVVEACSGLRALHSLAFFSLSYAYLFDSRPWVRWFLLACAVPVAIVANMSRVVMTGVVGERNPELAQGVYHTLSGWILFVIAIALLAGIHQLTTIGRRRPQP